MYIKKNTLIGIIAIGIIALFAVVFVVAQSITGNGQPVPNFLNYQGRLIDPATGQPIPDGNNNVTFRIFTDETGGSMLWDDTYTVETKNGLFNTLLGPIDATVFDGSDRWVEIEVDGEPISTRQRIVSVAYAIRATSAADADTLGGKPPSEFVTNPLDGNFTVNNGSVLFSGTTGTTPASGVGARMMWIPNRKAFRAGEAIGTEWDAENVGDYSFAVGLKTKASEEASTAMGFGTTASGYYSTAMGWGATASGQNSTAMGDNTTASGQGSTAMGNGSIASGSASTAMGGAATASGQTSTAIGHVTTASGNFSTAIGYGTTASGVYSTAIGMNTMASGNWSTVMGSYASTNNYKGSFVYGDYSTTTVVNATASNQFMVRAAGGTIFYSNSSLTSGVSLAPGGGSWSSVSDRNKKENFKEEDGEEALRKIAGMPISSWNYKSQHPSIRHVGPTAQDFYAAFHLGESDTTITTTDIDGINMLAIQALEKRTTELKAKIEELEKVRAELAEVKAENAEMKRKMAKFEAALQKLETLTATQGKFDESGTGKITNN